MEDDFILRQIRLLSEGVAKVAQLAPVEQDEASHDGQDGGEPPAPDVYACSATPRRDVAVRDDNRPRQVVTRARRAAGPPTSTVVALVFVASTWLRACGC